MWGYDFYTHVVWFGCNALKSVITMVHFNAQIHGKSWVRLRIISQYGNCSMLQRYSNFVQRTGLTLFEKTKTFPKHVQCSKTVKRSNSKSPEPDSIESYSVAYRNSFGRNDLDFQPLWNRSIYIHAKHCLHYHPPPMWQTISSESVSFWHRHSAWKTDCRDYTMWNSASTKRREKNNKWK